MARVTEQGLRETLLLVVFAVIPPFAYLGLQMTENIWAFVSLFFGGYGLLFAVMNRVEKNAHQREPAKNDDSGH